MADQVTTQQPPEAAPVDPFDLGDTSLPPFEVPDKPVPPKDPVTGKFVSTTPQPAQGTPTPPPAVQHPDYLVEQARFYGYSDADLADMTTTALSRAVAVSFRQYQAQMSQQRQLLERLGQEVTQPQPKPEPEPVDEWAALEQQLEPYDPPVRDAIKRSMKVARDAEARAKAAEDRLTTEFKTRDEAATKEKTAQNAQLLDRAFARLAEKDARYKTMFGVESAATLNAQSPEMRRRRNAMAEAGVSIDNVNPHTVVRQLQAAADLWNAPAAPEPAPAPNPYAPQPRTAPVNGVITPEEWQRGGVARPSNRNGAPEPDGKEKAVQNLTAKLRESGQLDNDPDILDGLL